MRGKWAGSLGLVVGLGIGSLQAEEVQWRSAPAATTTRPAATLGPPALLGRPVPVAPAPAAPIEDSKLTQTSYEGAALAPPQTATLAPPQPTVVRAQNPEYGSPTLAPMPSGIPLTPQEQYNAGVVTTPPPNTGGGFFGRCYDNCCDLFTCSATCPDRGLFQSDHCFDGFISPVSSPFLSEDPRALTELRPIFIYQAAPSDNWVFRGGSIEWFGVQGRLALTDRLSISMTKLGFIAQQPNQDTFGFDDRAGFSELWIGPKYTFIRNDRTGSLWAIGLQMQVATGPRKVFQDTDDLGLVPYLAWGQNFWRTSYGSMNFMNTTGYAFGTNSLRSDYVFSNFHLDYNVLNANKFYPLIEVNWRNYTQAGTNTNFQFEGGDLYNLGSQGVSGHTDLSLAFGFRYKFSEAVQFGLANEFPLTGARDLLDYRLTVDMIFRY
ncbi:MAG: hypothetical protein AB7K24_33320 [Gemmataceae bacterium]